MNIWKISHGKPNPERTLLSDDDHQTLVNNQYIAIGFVNNTEQSQRKHFEKIPQGDLFYLIRRGGIVLLAEFADEKVRKIGEDLKVDEGVYLNNENMKGWICRKFKLLKYANPNPYINNQITCEDNVRYLGYMPSGYSTVYQVPEDSIKQFSKDILTPVFGYELNKMEVPMNNNFSRKNMNPLNEILYGPPGTGKTYITACRAVKICLETEEKDIVKRSELIKHYDANRDSLMDKYKEFFEAGKIAFVTFHQSYGYEEFVEGLKPKLDNEQNHEDTLQSVDSGQVSYHISSGVFKEICSKASENNNKNYVIIIDEINRGNISKIFGELITLIEDDKREGKTNAISVTLPYSKQTFSVPKNVYIIGTMNTADRSLAQVDTALRRRFHFEPMMPEPEKVLKGIVIEDIEIEKMLTKINERIVVLYDREHTIGHAYFTKLKDSEKSDGSEFSEREKFEELKLIFRNKIIPLLEEYFFDDWHKIRLVLGDNQKEQAHQFIKEIDNNEQKKITLFGANNQLENELPKSYSINEDAFDKPVSFIGIYSNLPVNHNEQ